MTRAVRALFTFEALLTIGTGVQGMIDPAAFAAQFVDAPPTGTALDFIRWLMATYFVIATLELSLLRWGTRAAWRIALPPILLGDVLHLVAHALMIQNGGTVGPETWASFGFTLVFGTARILCLLDPSRVLRP